MKALAACALLAPLSYALLTSPSVGTTSFNTIPLGQTDMKGGTTKIGEVSPGSIPTSGPDASGLLCNEIKPGQNIHDLTFEIENGTAVSVEVDGEPNTIPFINGKAHVTLANGDIGGNGCKKYTLNDLSSTSTDTPPKNLKISVTPSLATDAGGSTTELNTIEEYIFTEMSDKKTQGIETLFHEGIAAGITNGEKSKKSRISALTGSVTVPSGFALTGVHLRTPGGVTVTGTATQITGDDFEVNGFTPLDVGDSYVLILVFNEALEGETLKVEVKADFN
jgi:hypothetical protein